ncbi:hypothetical protein SRABI133_04365 [Peribacillus simplex]|jgi:hypothetical protein|uniref:Trifolitoxin immunity protein n=1 Tax=Peribacillus simplex TaxID=1478 RepID=A0A9W4PIA4_9BACI|nr:hypothetical protein SRABI133_04365 [Peribacillus simplex]
MPHHENEEMLTGGNVSRVYRSGDTVRRELKPDSPKIHKLLKHLENKGFSYAPKFLGIDEKGREILSLLYLNKIKGYFNFKWFVFGKNGGNYMSISLFEQRSVET